MRDISLPVGAISFETIRQDKQYFVDKSYVISSIIRDNATTLLFTRPRRFGKTTLLTMLSSFFDISRDNRDLFEGLEIMNDREAANNWMGKYPELYISFKNVKANSFSDAAYKLSDTLLEVFENRKYLITENTDEAYLNLFQDILSGSPSLVSLRRSLSYLVRLIANYYKKPIILLIDEYDVPLASAEQNGYYNEMIEIMRSLFEVLKNDKHIKKAILTGCLRVSKESLFTGLNNLVSYSLLSQKYSDAFGFTDSEVSKFLIDTGFEEKKEIIKKWYDGYNIGGKLIYSAWDVVSYINDLQVNRDTPPQNYWVNSSGNDVIKRFIEITNASISDEYSTLINGGPIKKAISETLTYSDIYKSEDTIWSLLFETGYLTLTDNIYNPKEGARLKIPNEEVKDLFTRVVKEWFKERMEKSDKSDIYRDLFSKDEEKLSATISNMLMQTISYHDYGEDFYHAFLAGIFYYPKYFEVKSNKEHGLGRPDLFIRDINRKRCAILEFKSVKKEEDIEDAFSKAISQINGKRYEFDFSLKGFEVLKYAIVFYKKSAFARLVL